MWPHDLRLDRLAVVRPWRSLRATLTASLHLFCSGQLESVFAFVPGTFDSGLDSV